MITVKEKRPAKYLKRGGIGKREKLAEREARTEYTLPASKNCQFNIAKRGTQFGKEHQQSQGVTRTPRRGNSGNVFL